MIFDFVRAAMIFGGLLMFGVAVAVGPPKTEGFVMLLIGCAVLAVAIVIKP